MSTEAIVALHRVGKEFVGDPPISVLRDCSARIQPGEFAAIIGPSGSGKSTLLNILGILDVPTVGTYYLDGHDVGRMSDRARTLIRARTIGFVFQSFYLLPHYTALENVVLGAMYGGRERRARRLELGEQALRRVNLAHRIHAYPRTLSGGESQRVAIARATMSDPRVLLCDEPTGNLDTASTRSILNLLGELCVAGLTVVTVTHDPEVAQASTRRFNIRDGVLAEDTTAFE